VVGAPANFTVETFSAGKGKFSEVQFRKWNLITMFYF